MHGRTAAAAAVTTEENRVLRRVCVCFLVLSLPSLANGGQRKAEDGREEIHNWDEEERGRNSVVMDCRLEKRLSVSLFW